ncbi:MAG TPA: phosphotransferase [Hansschlegelia sp.]
MSDPAGSDALARILAKAPGLAGRSVDVELATPGVASPSYHAVESTTFRLAVAGEPRGFLKVTEPAIRDLIDLSASFEAAGAAAARGLAPAPLALFEEEGAILFEDLGADWRPARMDDLRRDGRLAGVLDAYGVFADGPALARSWSVFDGIETMWGLLGSGADTLPPDAWWLKRWTDAIGEAIAAAGVDLRPAHNDPHASNLMLGPDGGLRLVDFDMAANSDPYYQIGALLNEALQFDSEMARALEIYEGASRPASLARCRAYAAADDFYWGLRSLLLDRLSPHASLEFRKYAGWRFLRCRMLVGRPGFEETLRSL